MSIGYDGLGHLCTYSIREQQLAIIKNREHCSIICKCVLDNALTYGYNVTIYDTSRLLYLITYPHLIMDAIKDLQDGQKELKTLIASLTKLIVDEQKRRVVFSDMEKLEKELVEKKLS